MYLLFWNSLQKYFKKDLFYIFIIIYLTKYVFDVYVLKY
jgi:hypothetical protein